MPKVEAAPRMTTRASTAQAAATTKSTANPASKKKRVVDPDESQDDVMSIDDDPGDDKQNTDKVSVRSKPKSKSKSKPKRTARASSFIVDTDESESSEHEEEKQRLRRKNDALKRRKREIAEMEKAMKKAAKVAKKLEFRESQKMSLLDLPNEIIERCFSLDWGVLGLGDFLALSWTCRTFRDSMDEGSWEAIYMKAGPGKKGYIIDKHGLALNAIGEATIHVGTEIVSVPRALHCKAEHESRSAGHRYRSVCLGAKQRNNTGQTIDGGITKQGRLLALVQDHNDLLVMKAKYEKPRTFSLPYPMAYGVTTEGKEAHQARLEAWKVASEDHKVKKTEYPIFLAACSRMLLRKLPLSRGEAHASNVPEGDLPLKVRDREIGPWEVICLRAYNFPLMGMQEVILKTFLSASEIKAAIKPVPEEYVEEHFYAKDAERLITARKLIIKAKEAKVRAERNVNEAQKKLEYARQLKANKTLALLFSKHGEKEKAPKPAPKPGNAQPCLGCGSLACLAAVFPWEEDEEDYWSY